MRKLLVVALVIAVVSCQDSDEGFSLGGGGGGGGYQAPSHGYEAPAPSYQAPSYGYEAPAPSYGYEAPSYHPPQPQGYYVREPGKMERWVAKMRDMLNRIMDKKQEKAERFSTYRFVPHSTGYASPSYGYEAPEPTYGGSTGGLFSGFGGFDGGDSK